MQADKERLEGKRDRVERRLEPEVMAEPAMETGAALGEAEISMDVKGSRIERVDLEKGLGKETAV